MKTLQSLSKENPKHFAAMAHKANEQGKKLSVDERGNLILTECLMTKTELAADIRAKRNLLLALSDWTQTLDSPLSEKEKSAWAQYRQSLRDITKQNGFPNVVSFPEKP